MHDGHEFKNRWGAAADKEQRTEVKVWWLEREIENDMETFIHTEMHKSRDRAHAEMQCFAAVA